MQRPDLVPLNVTQMNNVWELYRKHPTVGSCAQVFRNSLLGEGVRINANADRIGNLDEGGNKFRTTRYEHVANMAMDWLITVGVVPVVFQWVPHIARFLPVVPQPEAVKLHVRLDSNGDRHYEGVLERGNSILCSVVTGLLPDQNAQAPVRVWAGGEYLPTSKGVLVTPITRLETSERFVSILRENVLVATHRMANPPLVTQPRAKRNTDQDGVMWNVDDQTAQDAEFSRLERVTNQDKQEANLREECWGGVGIASSRTEVQDFSERCKTHEYFLPSERELVNPQGSAYPTHYVDTVQQCEEKIYQVFGIPHAMFGNSGTNLQSNYMQMYSLNVNLRRMMAQIQKFLQEVFILAEKLGVMQLGLAANPGASGQLTVDGKPGAPSALPGNQESSGRTFFESTQHVPEDMVPSSIAATKGVAHVQNNANGKGATEKKRKRQSPQTADDPNKAERVKKDVRRDGAVPADELPEHATQDLDKVKDEKLKLQEQVKLEDFDLEADQHKKAKLKETGRLEAKELVQIEQHHKEDALDPFELAMNERNIKDTSAPHDAPVTLVMTPCMPAEEVNQQVESGVLSITEGINIQRGALGLPLLNERQAEAQKKKSEDRMVELEKQLTKARTPPESKDPKKTDGKPANQGNANGSSANKTNAPSASKPNNPKIVLEVKAPSAGK